MAEAGLLATVDACLLQKDQLTAQETDILNQITRASRDTTEITKKAADEKREVAEEYDTDSTEYEAAIDKIEDEFEVKLAEINQWEKELETKKQNIETEITALAAYQESFESVLKNNVKKDFTYGDQSS